jgi:putative hydrolase of the HAD superfamily
MPTPPKVIFFDAAGTLMYLPRSVGHHYADVAASCGFALDPVALDRAFHQAWKAMPPRSVTPDGSPQPDDDKGWWRELVRLVLHDAADAAAPSVLADSRGKFDFEGYFDVVYDHFARPGIWQAFAEVKYVLAQLRRRNIRLGVISNFDRRLFANLEDLGISEFFDHVTISSEVGADKPHQRIYQRALAAFGVSASDALHVGDDPVRDWAGAEAAGLRVFRLQRPKNDLRALLAE